MDMIRHEDVSPQTKLESITCPLDRLSEPFTCPLGFEKRIATIAGKRQRVSVPQFVEVDTVLFHQFVPWKDDKNRDCAPMKVRVEKHSHITETSTWGQIALVRFQLA